jgi:peptide/nickel transport system substrate-binding protein
VSCTKNEPAARRGGTIIVGEISDFESLNPMGTTDAHARDIYDQLFLELLDEQADFLTFKPRLAESYSFSDDRKQLTFNIRRGLVWSDGTPVTAHDVEATFRLQTDPDAAWSSVHLKKHIERIEAVDDHTVVYHFGHVYPYQIMDAVDGAILPKHFIERYEPKTVRTIPVEEIPTNGPFRIEKWIRGQSLTLVPYEGYFEEGKPYLEKVIFKIIPDQVTLLTQVRNGEIDCMESLPPREVDNLKQNNPNLEILTFPTRQYNYIAWNGARPLFRNIRVRRALTMAIDRQRIIDNLYYGYAEICTSPFVPLIWAYNPNIEPIPFDPDEARRMLAAEGFADTDGDGWLDKDGERFEFEIMTNYGNQIRMDTQVMVQEMLRKVGIKARPLALEWTVFLERYKANDFDAVVQAWRIGTKADLSPIWSCEARRVGGYNRVDYCNPTVDSLNALAASILDFEEARPLFYRVQEIIYEEQPYTFLYTLQALNAISRRIEGAKPDAISVYHNLHEWWIREQ